MTIFITDRVFLYYEANPENNFVEQCFDFFVEYIISVHPHLSCVEKDLNDINSRVTMGQ